MMKSQPILSILSLLILSLSFSLLSCGEGEDEIYNNTNENNGIHDNPAPVLSEEKLKSIIDQNVNAQVSYMSKNYRCILSSTITSTIQNKIPNASIKYGLEYGLREANSFFVEYDDFKDFTSQLAVSIIIPSSENGATNENYSDYISYYGTYVTLYNKAVSGQGLSSNERNLLSSVATKLNNAVAYMEKYFKARTYVSVNNTRYYLAYRSNCRLF